MDSLTLTYSLADQNFGQTKSLGIFNVSTTLLEKLIARIPFGRLNLLTNSTLNGKLILSEKVGIEYHDEAILSRFGRIFWDQWGVYEAAKKSGNEWLFLPKGFASFLRQPAFKLAVYVYDAIHDFYRIHYPSTMPWFEREYFGRSLKNTLQYSKVVFTDSHFAKEELERLARKWGLKIPTVIMAGIGFERGTKAVGEKHDSLLLLTSAWPHKLTRQAIGFVERWQNQTGFSGNVELVGSLPAGICLPRVEGWHYHPRLSEELYKKFLAEAKVLLFFSAYEGFGMPPVEAIIVGTCPVYSDLPVTREVMERKGFSFTNGSYESFTQSMDRALSVPETQIQLWGEQLLARYHWDGVVEKIMDGLTRLN